EYKKTMSIHDMAKHMAEHNTPFSEGTIEGILRDFVRCTREQCLNGNTVKIDDLAIFKCSVEANGLQLAEDYKINCGLGTIPTKGPDGTGVPDFTKKELNSDSSFRWTKAAAKKIDSLINPVEDEGDGD
ncbi:MAG: hypothetical protein J5734_02740, partial [Prevotella sp.]|nr:hypothetical protein [Prevotella sp.]